MLGSASLTRLAKDPPPKPGASAAVGGKVEVSECFQWFAIFFATGEASTHEELIERILTEHNADYLADAELTTSVYGFPYVYISSCATVRGRPVRIEEKEETRI
jgi:hypothetical protein